MGRSTKQECLTLYPEIADMSKCLSDKQLGALMRAVIQYRFEGTTTDFSKSPTLACLFPLMKNQVDRMEEVKKRNSENAKIRWEKASQSQNADQSAPDGDMDTGLHPDSP